MKTPSNKISWKSVAKNVEPLFQAQVERIKSAVSTGDMGRFFDKFLAAMQTYAVREINAEETIDTLALYWFTGPALRAVFKGCPFASRNAVSRNLDIMTRNLMVQGCLIDAREALRGFYDVVERRMEGVHGAGDRQDVIHEICQNFLTIALPRLAEQLGIVYTPKECVDYIVRSCDELLRKEFGRSVNDPDVTLCDPFAGTGTFVVLMIHMGIIDKEALRRKYERDIVSNEIVMFPWYIGLIAIESAYHEVMGHDEYVPFRGMRLVDTFAEGEKDYPPLASEAKAIGVKKGRKQC